MINSILIAALSLSASVFCGEKHPTASTADEKSIGLYDQCGGWSHCKSSKGAECDRQWEGAKCETGTCTRESMYTWFCLQDSTHQPNAPPVAPSTKDGPLQNTIHNNTGGYGINGVPPLVNPMNNPVMTDEISLAVIYYGANFQSSQKDFVKKIDKVLNGLKSGSEWFNEAKSYAPKIGKIGGHTNFFQPKYTVGKFLDNSTVEQLVLAELKNDRKFSKNPNSIAIVITDSSATGFPFADPYPSGLKGALVTTDNPVPPVVIDGKTYQPAQGGYIDRTVELIISQIISFVTNPYISNAGWLDGNGYTPGVMCNGHYPLVADVPKKPGYVYNLRMSGEYFLVHPNYRQIKDKSGTLTGICPAQIYSS